MRGTLHHGLLGASTTSGGGGGSYYPEYLELMAGGNGVQISFSKEIKYRINGGTWYTLSVGDKTPSIDAFETIQFKGTLTPTYSQGVGTFTIHGSSAVYLQGNCMSLIFGDEAGGRTSLEGFPYAFKKLFYEAQNLTYIIGENILPATTLSAFCYDSMFAYSGLIDIQPTILPATNLADACYTGMFTNCSDLINAPLLPATTLAGSCYMAMFSRCTSLTTGPTLLAKTLVESCYWALFYYCENLNYIKMLATSGFDSEDCLDIWVEGVASSGTFVKHPNASIATGIEGIPSGWTVQTATS